MPCSKDQKKKCAQQPSCSCCPPPPPSCCQKPKPKPKKPKCALCDFTKGNSDCCCESCREEIEQEEEEAEEQSLCFEPCFIEPTPPKPGPEAYEEFEASFNNSGLVIRVLKNTHIVQAIDAGDDCLSDEDEEKFCNKKCNNPIDDPCDSLTEMMQRSSYVQKKLEARTTGNIINHPNIPKVRANIKYAGRESCCPENFNVPLNKLKTRCDALGNKIEFHRRGTGNEEPQCNHISAMGAGDTRTCCAQVDPKILQATMMGKQMDNRKKGIEVRTFKRNPHVKSILSILLSGQMANSGLFLCHMVFENLL